MGIVTNLLGARVAVSSSTASGAFAVYTSAIDKVTNDPRTLLPR
jgi:hypothetical protein